MLSISKHRYGDTIVRQIPASDQRFHRPISRAWCVVSLLSQWECIAKKPAKKWYVDVLVMVFELIWGEVRTSRGEHK